MINLEDQNSMFRLISSNLRKDIECFAFGGTAMMYYGYKDSTKDIDLLFEKEDDRKEFIRAIMLLGYREKSIMGIYPSKIEGYEKPLMFTRGDERFDLFAKKIFHIELSKPMMERFYERHDYKAGKHALIIKAMAKEDIVLLKSVTEREKDFEDILALFKKGNIDWDIIIDEAKSQKDRFTLLDLEKTMQKLKEKIFIPKETFKKVYS
jgi:hypothetical protein